ncbi:nuclear transport factor 2 family protein [Streptomyces longwoodensis]|uniref:nuclear transport factor 2 family protein n=1 Tax=Streptomyces longwoodensis TaxID=68231 RepID=UPI0033E4D70E
MSATDRHDTDRREPADRYEGAVARYFEAWNAREPETLAKAVAAAWATDGTYTDPLADVRGHEQIRAAVSAAHAAFPGFVFRLSGAVDGHHDTARFSWELVSEADGSAPVAGFDVITLDGEDRITSVLGFLDRVPATA